MDVLIVLGTTAAFAYSVASIVLDAALGLESVNFFEISILLITFVYLGSYLETYAKGKTSEVRISFLFLSLSQETRPHGTQLLTGHNQVDVAPGSDCHHC